MNAADTYLADLRTLLNATPQRDVALAHVSQQENAAERAAQDARDRAVAEAQQKRRIPTATLNEAEQFARRIGATHTTANTDLSTVSLPELRTQIGQADAQWQHIDSIEHHLGVLEQAHQNRNAGTRGTRVSRIIVLGAAGLVTIGILTSMMPHMIGM
ncbi:hypothetical protein ACWGJ9_09580 [Curtobacterium citreum]